MKTKRKPSLEARLRRKYTRVDGVHCQYTVWLKVGSQSFIVNNIPLDNRQEAEWFRTQLAIALATIVMENK